MKITALISTLIFLFSASSGSAEQWEQLMGGDLVKKSGSDWHSLDSSSPEIVPERFQEKKSNLLLKKDNNKSKLTLSVKHERSDRYNSVVALTIDGQKSCTGILREGGLILTAAHCITQEGSDLKEYIKKVRVYVGNGNDSSTISGQHKVSKAVVHPYYFQQKSGLPLFDIAVLVLKNPKHPDFASARIIPSASSDYTDFYKITEYHSISFGNDSKENSNYNGTEKKQLTKYSWLTVWHMTLNKHPATDTYPGDSGTPIFGTTKDGNELLVGIHNTKSTSYNAAYAKYWLDAHRQGTRIAITEDLFSSAINTLFTRGDSQFDPIWSMLQEKNNIDQLEWLVKDLPRLLTGKVSQNFARFGRLIGLERQGKNRPESLNDLSYGFYTATEPCRNLTYYPMREKNSFLYEGTIYQGAGDSTCNSFTDLYTPLLCDLLQEVMYDKSKTKTINGIDEFTKVCHESKFSLKMIREFL